jgi:hypothetical protein
LESFCMHIVVFSCIWSLGLFVHACMFCLPLYLLPGYL